MCIFYVKYPIESNRKVLMKITHFAQSRFYERNVIQNDRNF